MVALGVILISAGCAAYQYFKGTFAKAFATIIITICANAVAFGYFEVLADVFISRGENSKNAGLIPWAQSLSFVLLFVLALLIFQTILGQLMKSPVNLGFLAERIGRVACGIFLGLILSGTLITALAMAPLPTKWPYQRFAPSNPNAEKPTKAFLGADSLVTSWFGALSNGGFAGKSSFALAHADFLDQAFLNRHNLSEEVLLVTTSNAIEVPSKKATWPAPADLKDSSGTPMSAKSGHNLMIVRIGLKKTAVREAGAFTLSQLRLVCNKKSNKDPLAGKGKSVYPIGYLKTANQVQEKRLDDLMKIEAADFAGKVKWIDFVFSVPNDSRGVLVEFKQNSIAEIPTPVAAE